MIARLILALSLMAVVEYLIHRYAQHRPTLAAFKGVLHRHAVLHHRDRRNDLNIDLPPWFAAVLASPAVLAAILLGDPEFGMTFLAVAVAHAFAWTHLHRCFHGVGSHFMRDMPGYWFLLHHHIGHHNNPTKNFGAAFGPLIDTLAGTRADDGHARR